MREPDPDELDDAYRVDCDGVRRPEPWVSGAVGPAELVKRINAEVDRTRGMTLEEFAEYLRNGRRES